MTAGELADAAGINARYAREWLEQQAVAGILDVAEDGEADERRFGFRLATRRCSSIPRASRTSSRWPASRSSFASVLPNLDEAFRTGGGVPWTAFGEEGLDGAGGGQPTAVREPPRHRVAACDAGRPRAAQLGAARRGRRRGLRRRLVVDRDRKGVSRSRGSTATTWTRRRSSSRRRTPRRRASADRVTLPRAGRGRRRARRSLRPRDRLRGDPRHLAPGRSRSTRCARSRATTARCSSWTRGSPTEFSRARRRGRAADVHVQRALLPRVGLADRPTAATGTVMRTDTLRAYAQEAGFAEVEVLPVEHDFFRFYRLRI